MANAIQITQVSPSNTTNPSPIEYRPDGNKVWVYFRLHFAARGDLNPRIYYNPYYCFIGGEYRQGYWQRKQGEWKDSGLQFYSDNEWIDSFGIDEGVNVTQRDVIRTYRVAVPKDQDYYLCIKFHVTDNNVGAGWFKCMWYTDSSTLYSKFSNFENGQSVQGSMGESDYYPAQNGMNWGSISGSQVHDAVNYTCPYLVVRSCAPIVDNVIMEQQYDSSRGINRTLIRGTETSGYTVKLTGVQYRTVRVATVESKYVYRWGQLQSSNNWGLSGTPTRRVNTTIPSTDGSAYKLNGTARQVCNLPRGYYYSEYNISDLISRIVDDYFLFWDVKKIITYDFRKVTMSNVVANVTGNGTCNITARANYPCYFYYVVNNVRTEGGFRLENTEITKSLTVSSTQATIVNIRGERGDLLYVDAPEPYTNYSISVYAVPASGTFNYQIYDYDPNHYPDEENTKGVRLHFQVNLNSGDGRNGVAKIYYAGNEISKGNVSELGSSNINAWNSEFIPEIVAVDGDIVLSCVVEMNNTISSTPNIPNIVIDTDLPLCDNRFPKLTYTLFGTVRDEAVASDQGYVPYIEMSNDNQPSFKVGEDMTKEQNKYWAYYDFKLLPPGKEINFTTKLERYDNFYDRANKGNRNPLYTLYTNRVTIETPTKIYNKTKTGQKWKSAIPYIYHNREWKPATPYIYKNGAWITLQVI